MRRVWAFILSGVCTICAPVSGQQSRDASEMMKKARQEFREGKYVDAERDFRQVVAVDPSDIYALIFLGQSLFNQQKYTDALSPYEQALALERKSKMLSLDQKRILGDQLAMTYGLSGDLGKAKSLLKEAIKDDPEYALNYYNLACTFAEMKDRDRMLDNLSLAFKHKNQTVKGEHLPDPRSDSSFEKYLKDEGFVRLMNEVGLDPTEDKAPRR